MPNRQMKDLTWISPMLISPRVGTTLAPLLKGYICGLLVCFLFFCFVVMFELLLAGVSSIASDLRHCFLYFILSTL